MREKIGEAADRRHTAPVASVALLAALCGMAVIILHEMTARVPALLGSYRSGIITVVMFVAAATYSVRKHVLGLSVRWLRLAMLLPRWLAVRMVALDRLESWRAGHVTIGVFALLPFWWHVDAGSASRLEVALKIMVLVLVASGLAGTMIQDLLPPRIRKRPDQEVRIQDVEAGYQALYVEAEEAVLGHSEQVVHAYLRHVRPILSGRQPARKMLWATLTGSDPAPTLCGAARQAYPADGADAGVYAELVGIAERKVRLEHNRFNLRMSVAWLKFHFRFALAVVVLVVFHVIGVLYFAGI